MVQALTHDATYGTVTRTISTSTNTWAQGASITGAYTDNATPYTANIANFRLALHKLSEAGVEKPSDVVCVVGPVLFDVFRSLAESKIPQQLPKNSVARYGFDSVYIDGVEIICDYMLTAAKLSGNASKIFFLNLPKWTLELHPDRNFEMEPFTPQGNIIGGRDIRLSHVKVAGNFYCTQPASSLYGSNWS
jgi:hypothetical protein